MEETLECSICLAESVPGDTTGWVQGEFGDVCPECAYAEVPTGESVGVTGVMAAVGVKKKDEQ